MSSEAFVSQAGKEWLDRCHPSPTVAADVRAGFSFRIHKIRLLGHLLHGDLDEPIERFEAIPSVQIVRLRLRRSDFGMFFRIAAIRGQPSVIVDTGTTIPRHHLTADSLEVARRGLDRYIVALERDPTLREQDRMR